MKTDCFENAVLKTSKQKSSFSQFKWIRGVDNNLTVVQVQVQVKSIFSQETKHIICNSLH